MSFLSSSSSKIATSSMEDSHSPLPYSPPKQSELNFSTTKHSSSSRRACSISSSSSISSSTSSNFSDDSPSTPATPLRFSGIPFSWEHLPGIPKKLSQTEMESTLVKILPLPPPQASSELGIRKKIPNPDQCSERDPFFAALVECSKDDHHDESSNFKVSRSISDRFGFINLYTSCKRTCTVSESLVYLPRSSRTKYDLITRRRSS